MEADGLDSLSVYDKEIKILLTKQSVSSVFREEQTRVKKNISKYQGFQDLMERYHEYAQSYEGVIPYMYLDSRGYPTIGCGHLIGFGWKKDSFWGEPIVRELVRTLEQQITDKNLESDPGFKKFDFPEEVNRFLQLSKDDYINLYKVTCVCYGFLDVQKLGKEGDFEQVNETHLRLRIKEANTPNKHQPQESSLDRVHRILNSIRKTPVKDIDEALFKAYTLLLGISVKLKARQKKLERSGNNPFGGSKFYNFNNLNIKVPDNQDNPPSSSSERLDYSKKYYKTFLEEYVGVPLGAPYRGLDQYPEFTPTFKLPKLPNNDKEALLKNRCKEFRGTFKRDLVVAHYHGQDENKEQSYQWWTPALWANREQTDEDIHNAFGLLKEWEKKGGVKTKVVIARIPAGAEVTFLHGKANEQLSTNKTEKRSGGSEQYCFCNFDPQWIIEERPMPVGHGYNNLVMKANEIEELTKRDIFLKIAELDARLDLRRFPPIVQLALLDLAFNMGANGINKHVIKAAINEQWDLLVSNPKWYEREGMPARNTQVQNWFKEAAKG
jgi:GH24 family phage-related lysozyme (muramidase)